jgi:type II secretory pathway pseudopilin PulG
MTQSKIKSFTLSEMLVVMVITVIVVGIAFSVLSLVQKQIRGIKKNYQKTTELSLLEQRLWQDFNEHHLVNFDGKKLMMISDIDTVKYIFTQKYILRNLDTIPLSTEIANMYYLGKKNIVGEVDAIALSANAEIPDYNIFVSKKHDASHFINNNGL